MVSFNKRNKYKCLNYEYIIKWGHLLNVPK